MRALSNPRDVAPGPIPISSVQVGFDEEQLVLEVLRSGRLAQGPMVERLERMFCELVGSRHAVAVSSGTTALVAALEVLELEPGDEVLTSSFTFVATLNAILEAGAVARFVDIDDDFVMDPDALEVAVTPRTRVIMPVHLYGLAADMNRITAVAASRDCHIVEDAAQAHGARVGDRAVGAAGLGCFSLYATKNVAAGEGGVITTDDDRLADRLRLLRNQGMRARYEYELAGHNYRLTDLHAAVALPQLARLQALTDARRRNARRLTAGLKGIPGLTTPRELPDRSHVFHQYTVRVDASATRTRDELAEALAERGIATGIYYPRSVYQYDCYRDHPQVQATATPRSDQAAREVLSLPVHPHLTIEQIDRIIDSVRSTFDA